MRTRSMTPLTTRPVTGTLADPHSADADLDGVVKYAGAVNDRDVVLQTIRGAVPTATRTEQLP